jgi:hypothetical protein
MMRGTAEQKNKRTKEQRNKGTKYSGVRSQNREPRTENLYARIAIRANNHLSTAAEA